MSESWDFYFCRVDHRPASIFLDSGIFESTPFRSRPHLAYLRLFFRIDREDGLTSDEESDTLREIEHGLQEELAQHGDRLQYVGHNTTDGSRVFCIDTVNGVWAETVLSSYMTRFPDYEFEAGWQDDPDWSVYLDFLYPDARAQFARRAAAEGFTEASREDGSEPPRPFGLVLQKASSVEYGRINDLTLTLYDLAEELGGEFDGEFDGWGCHTAKGEEG